MSDITIVCDRSLPEAGLLELYGAAGWQAYLEPGLLREAYSRSLYALGAFDGGRLVGAVRAVGDGCTIILIQDLLVLPEYRRRGIGRLLLEQNAERLFPCASAVAAGRRHARTERFLFARRLCTGSRAGLQGILVHKQIDLLVTDTPVCAGAAGRIRRRKACALLHAADVIRRYRLCPALRLAPAAPLSMPPCTLLCDGNCGVIAVQLRSRTRCRASVRMRPRLPAVH